MLQDLLETIPAVVVGVAFLLILIAVLRREMGGKSDGRDRRRGRRDS